MLVATTGYYGVVVRAREEAAARRIADSFPQSRPRGIWSDPEMAGCRQVDPEGRSAVVLVGEDMADVSRMIGD
jgi:hypothetical protein